MRAPTKTPSASCTDCDGKERCVLSGVVPDPGKELPGLLKGFRFAKDEIIPLEYQQRIGFHVLRSGHAHIRATNLDAKTVKIAGPGDLIGFCHENSRHLRAEALEQAETCFCPEQEMRALVSRNPEVNIRVLKYLCRENWKNSERMAGLAHHSVKNRVLCLLQELARDFGVPSPHGKKIGLKLSRTMLGEMSGAVNETLARVLTELEKEEVIVREKWLIHLRPPFWY